ncbi:MAG TPA: hypothetical protein VG104_01185 [Candidatus Dormibacteraeota bacterium]|jgi:hypothetical protein|nr:hypothetical protein [Candidatus Dormibacteraeota bacterium]
MRATPAVRRTTGPFVVPARYILLIGGLLAIGLGSFNLLHELHAGQVDRTYTIVVSLVGVVWLAAILFAFLGRRLAIFAAGLLAFIEFGVIASTHFVVGPVDIDVFWKTEGLPVATVDMALIACCVLVAMSAVVCWSAPRGRNPDLATLPILIVALLGSVCVILQATDDIHRANFGRANAEDGTFAATVLASAWLVGALWVAQVRRTGALVIALATFGVWYSFVTLHLVTGGTSVTAIASKSGPIWAAVAAGAAILAGASFLLAIGLLVLSFVPRRKSGSSAAPQAVRRGA